LRNARECVGAARLLDQQLAKGFERESDITERQLSAPVCKKAPAKTELRAGIGDRSHLDIPARGAA
jgi:hypothetical protein